MSNIEVKCPKCGTGDMKETVLNHRCRDLECRFVVKKLFPPETGNNNNKVCKLINTTYSWLMEVDDREINIPNLSSAEYFESLFTKLGYKVEWD